MSTSAGATGETSPEPRRFPWPVLAFGLAFPTLLTLVYFVVLARAPRPLQQGVYTAGKLLQFGLPVAWWIWSRGRLPGPAWPGWRGALGGLASGLVVLASGLALYHGLLAPRGLLDGAPAEAIRMKVAGFGLTAPAAFLALTLFYSVIHSAAEEYYWRWFVFGGLRDALGAGPAIPWSSLGFMAHHVVLLSVFFGPGSPLTWALSAAVACGGAFWAWLYQRTGSLVGPWLSHLCVDVAIFAIGWDLVH